MPGWKKWLSIAGYVGLFISAILLIFSPFIDVIGVNIKAHTWVGIFCGILAGFVLHFAEAADSLERMNKDYGIKLQDLHDKFQTLVSLRDQIKNLPLHDAIRIATKNKHINQLRIYASTTAVIFQIIRDLGLQIEDCKVMIQYFSEDDVNPYSKRLNDVCLDLIDAWNEMQSIGKIKDLEIIRYNRYPSELVIIVEDRYLIQGKYTPSATSKHGSNYLEPILYDNKEVASKALIETHINWFDATFNHYKNHCSQSSNQ